jgi:hypothetical protein
MLDFEEGAKGCLERHVGGLGVRGFERMRWVEYAMGKIGD